MKAMLGSLAKLACFVFILPILSLIWIVVRTDVNERIGYESDADDWPD